MTELIWDGKYDKDGKKIAPVRIALPFQTIETVNESAEDRKRTGDMFAAGRETEWRNRLIWGDKKYVLPSLMPEFAGKVNLIYIDPPFDTGADFSYTAQIPDDPDEDGDESTSFTKEPSMIETKAYRDTWGKGLDSYMHWFYESIVILRELLTDDGSIYVHLDWHVGQYAKTVLDEVFGTKNFRNEIIWKKIRVVKAQSASFGNVHDVLYLFSKSDSYKFFQQKRAQDSSYEKKFDKVDESTGRRYQLVSLVQEGQGPPRKFGKQTLAPGPGRHWIWSQERIDKALKEGLIEITSGGTPRKKQFLDESEGRIVDDMWEDIFPVNSQALEDTTYATQKPESLLSRVMNASSNENDLILDCFCGSGTTAAVAEKLGRRWITCDLGRFAIHTTRKRLLGIPNVKPFVVQNLGKYERQEWAKAELGQPPPGPRLEKAGESLVERAQAEETYRNFILELYHATPIKGYTWLHGAKAGRMVHVGSVDSPVAIGDVKSIVQEFWRLAGKTKGLESNGVDVLGWEFAFDINETARQIAAENKVELKTKKIPREVLEKKAVEQGDIKFYELAYLNVKSKVAKKKLTLELKDFIMPPDDIPQEVLKNITHWSQWIDYWAVDWEYGALRGDTFHNEWQSYRTKKEPKIDLTVTHEYANAGTYTVLVKVIDILGNDTTKSLEVTI